LQAPTIAGHFDEILVNWKIETIRQDLGKNYLAKVPKDDGLSKSDDLAGRGHGDGRCQGKVLYRAKGLLDGAFRGGPVKRCGDDNSMMG